MVDFNEIEKTFNQADLPDLKDLPDMADLKKDTQAIIREIKFIPYGEVKSYKEVANLVGFVNGARQVARILHSLSKKYQLPWWRVIRSDGRIALTGEGRVEQIRLLKIEGLEFDDLGRIKKKN